MTPRPRVSAPGRFSVMAHIDRAAVRAAIDANPRLRQFMHDYSRLSGRGDPHAAAFLEFIVARVIDDVGELHMSNVIGRLERIQVLRDNIAGILDVVLEGGELPPHVRMETLGEYFDELSLQMRELSRPREALVGDAPLRLHDESWAYADDLLREFEGETGALAAGGRARPDVEIDAMRGRLGSLSPDRRAAIRKAAELEPNALVRVLTEETQGQALTPDIPMRRGRAPALAQLEAAIGGRMSAAELEHLRAAIDELGRARARAAQVTPDRLAPVLRTIQDPHLRAVVAAGDVWIIQQLAMHNLSALETLWANFRRNGGDDAGTGFRGYVRHQMVTFGRATPAEFTAAFCLSSIEMFLKGPDDAPNIRGTDLVGIADDGWVTLIDDKSHRTASVSSVPALTDHLATNLRSDVRAFRAQLAELQRLDPEFVPDPRVVDALRRMELTADHVERVVRDAPVEQRPAMIRSVLRHHQLRMRITSAMGEVVEISDALRALGMAPQPTGPVVVPLPRPGGQ